MERRGITSEGQVIVDGLLLDYMRVIEATRQGLEQIPTEKLPRVGWDQVVSMAEKFATEATSVGVVWHGDVSDTKPLADNMEEYFGLLQRVIMLGHGATRDAGSTLAACMRASVKLLVDASMNLIRVAVFNNDNAKERNGDIIPKLIGLVWESWIVLGKTPSNNVTAIGEALAQVAVSVEKTLRKKGELKETSSDPSKEVKDKASGEAGSSTELLKEGSCDSPENIKDKVSVDVGSKTEHQKEGSCDQPEEIKEEVSVDAGSSIEKGSCDPPEEIKEDVSGDSGSGIVQQNEGSCDPPKKIKGGVSGDAGSCKTVLKEPPSVPPDEIQDKASGEVGSRNKEVEKASSDLLQDDKVKAFSIAGSNYGEVEKASCEPLQDGKGKASSEAGSSIRKSEVGGLSPEEMTIARLTTNAVSEILDLLNQHGPAVIGLLNKERKGAEVNFVGSLENVLKKVLKEVLKEAPYVPPDEVQDEASGEMGSSSKVEKASRVSLEDDRDKVSNEARSSNEKVERASCDPLGDAKDKASTEAGSSNKEVDKASCDSPEDVKDKASFDQGNSSRKSDAVDLSPEDQKTIARLISDAVSGLVDLLYHLGPAVMTLLNKELEGTVANFVDSVENILKMGKVIESQIENFVHPQDLSARRVAFTNISKSLRELAVTMHQLNGGRYSKEFTRAWTNCIQMMRHLAIEYKRYDPV